jgi:hypothetical protein
LVICLTLDCRQLSKSEFGNRPLLPAIDLESVG